MILDGNPTLRRVETMAAAPMGEELAMIDLDTGKYLVLDRLGAVIWEDLREPVLLEDLLAGLGERYEVTPAQCRADVERFLALLATKGLLHVSEA